MRAIECPCGHHLEGADDDELFRLAREHVDRDHPEIQRLRLIHGVVSHPPHFVPLDHAWVELPGDIVFDGVVQTFFTRSSYYSVMAAVALDAYSAAATRRLVDTHGRPGPWNAKWVPTARQLEAYAAAVRTRQGVRIAAPLSVNVGMNR